MPQTPVSPLIATITPSGQLGPFLKALRRQRRLSQEELGKTIGLSQERISKIENHPESVTFDQILTLLMALGAVLTVEPRMPLGGQARVDSRLSATRSVEDKEAW